MANQKSFILFSIIVFFFTEIISAESGRIIKGLDGGVSNLKMFVFGDSYADTGNTPKPGSSSWKKPYGISFPGHPDGRFSNGLILPDKLASHYGIESPTPYEQRKSTNKSAAPSSGMNFAYGGTGVFDTSIKLPNMTTQIDFFQKLIEGNVYSKQDLNSSIALVTLAGNDYMFYLGSNSKLTLDEFTNSVINQLSIDLKRIQSLGIKNIGVTTIEPFGCLPSLGTDSSYKNCNPQWNTISQSHNKVLQQQIVELNKNQSIDTNVFTLDLYNAFLSALESLKRSGAQKPLKSCCVGVSSEFTCGSVDPQGVEKYIVCEKPDQSLFWDNVHPTQNGWTTIFSFLNSSLPHIY